MPIEDGGPKTPAAPATPPPGPAPFIPPPDLNLTVPGPLAPGLLVPVGKARWDELLTKQGFQMPSMGSEKYDEWVLSLAEDPGDAEYTAIVREQKAQAQRRKEQREAEKAEQVTKTATNATGFKRAEANAEFDTRPRFLGGDVQDPNDSTKPQSAAEAELKEFTKNNKGIPLDNGMYADRMKTSGQYVYSGTEASRTGDRSREVYQSADQAKTEIFDIPEAKIKAYQKMLGLPETGKVDKTLQSVWNDAVEMAQGYATQGHKITVQELFDIQMRAYASQRASRGGGGGGGGGLEQDPEDMAATDYYMAMMQILGDISGVSS